jgi:branched-subunit amino acid ABC-type transport system permease component
MLLAELSMIPLQTSASYLSSQVLNGVVLGMTLVLVALGLSIIFGMMGIINFAHGGLLLIGTYIAWAVFDVTNSLILAILAAPVVVGLVGALIERVTLRFTYDRTPLLQLLLTFGLAEILRESVIIIWGSRTKSFPSPDWASGLVNLGFVEYPIYRMFVIVFTGIVVACVYLFLYRTDIGMLIRAGTYDRQMVDLLGIDISRMFLIVFVVGSAVAGIAGAIIAPIRGVYPQLGVELLIPSFVVVIVGGIGSLRGTVISGLLVGQLIVLTGAFEPRLQNIIVFLFMAAVLIVKPGGLFGGQEVGA